MTIVGGEERARQFVQRALNEVDWQMDHFLPADGESGRDCERRRLIETMADYMLTFAAEASGIGMLDEARIIEIANKAVDENLNEDGTAKFGTAQGFACAQSALRLAASISSMEAG